MPIYGILAEFPTGEIRFEEGPFVSRKEALHQLMILRTKALSWRGDGLEGPPLYSLFTTRKSA